ncbi:MAG: urease accessory protein UreD [Clostridiales bacterium]|jgi:urease accessory protein|nr:urease accessory protein UreD [Clostridiales bacterium]
MSELFVKTEHINGRTVLSDCSFTAPLKVAKPFYRDDGYSEIMVMCASPGMLDGDCYDMRFEIGDNTALIISGQAYQKILNTGGGAAEQNVRIQVGENAALCYLPRPVIPFAGSKFHSRMYVALNRSSILFFGDILTCGRGGMGERFAFSEFTSRIAVSVEGRPAFLDNNRLFPDGAALDGIGFFEGYSCQGLLYLYGYDNVSLPQSDGIEAAVSKAREGYAARIFGNSGDAVYEFAQNIFCSFRCSARKRKKI